MKNPQVYQQVDEDTYSLTITQRIGKQHTVLIDADDVDTVSRHCWCVVSKGYVQTKINGRYVSLHRFVMDAKERTEEVDHINHNQLDNRKNNMRLCNRSENQRNTRLRYDNCLGIKNVCMYVGNGKDLYSRASVKLEGKLAVKQFSVKKLGLMPAVRDAAIAARALREQLHGQYACH